MGQLLPDGYGLVSKTRKRRRRASGDCYDLSVRLSLCAQDRFTPGGGLIFRRSAVIASAAICFAQAGIEVLGIRNGYTYLMEYKPGQML